VDAIQGTYALTFNVTKSGNTLAALGYASVDPCQYYTPNKISGDSVAGYNLGVRLFVNRDSTPACPSADLRKWAQAGRHSHRVIFWLHADDDLAVNRLWQWSGHAGCCAWI